MNTPTIHETIMTNEQINIAIAEACNKVTVDSWGEKYPIPDYCNDLNAMHEAEKALTDDQYHTGYKQTLASLVGLSGNMRVMSATAAQRAEAFLRTIGKWEEASK
jgi:hypothetical protein